MLAFTRYCDPQYGMVYALLSTRFQYVRLPLSMYTYVYVCRHMVVYMYINIGPPLPPCMAYEQGVGGRSYMAQTSRNSIAVVFVMQIGGGNKGMIDSCTHKNK